jgi:hypothetical protein
LLRAHGIDPPLSTRLTAVVTASLMDRPTRDLWAELTGQKVSQAPDRAWPAYQEHIERRNKLVHAGERATAEQADASLKAVTRLMHALIRMASDKESALKKATAPPE